MKKILGLQAPMELTCPDVFVVGYGMDAAHAFRQLPFVGLVDFDNTDPDLFDGE